MLTNLFLMLRHGPTNLNQADEYRGWSNGPDADLNNDGLWAAREAGSILLNYKTPLKYIISSPLNRTIHTAAIVGTMLGISQMSVDERLRPLNVGDLAGKKKSEHPIDAYIEDKNKSFPNGESVREFEERQHSFATSITDKIQGDNIGAGELLVIAHVSNVMYWHNLQSGNIHADYLQETTDLVMPGGLVIITDDSVLPLWKQNPEAYEKDIVKEDKNVG